MILFPDDIPITETDFKCLLHIEADPEQWIAQAILEKARLRREALIKDWMPRLFGDSSVTELPADANELVQLIMARPDYRSRAQADAEQNPPVPPSRYNIARFEGRTARLSGSVRRGMSRNPSTATLVLARNGLNVPDLMASCILAYVQDLEDWVLGALLGHINRGKKKMIGQYQPILMADPSVATFPATEDGLIEFITARPDYESIPNHFARLIRERKEEAAAREAARLEVIRLEAIKLSALETGP